LTRRAISSPNALMIVEERNAYWNPVTTPTSDADTVAVPIGGGSVIVAIVRSIASPSGKPMR
jgi:hypothetical protein